jgi:hypothetical protein
MRLLGCGVEKGHPSPHVRARCLFQFAIKMSRMSNLAGDGQRYTNHFG